MHTNISTSSKKTNKPSLGLALGGGGARGLAHILAFEVIDACGITPSTIAGTSMGSIMGALYASGKSGAQIREGLEKMLVAKNDNIKDILSKTPNLFKWLSIVRVEMNRGGLLKTDKFLHYLMEEIGVTTFEELKIPLHVVTTDFWSGEEVVISSGELLPAINASMAIPGIFAPVVIEDRVLVDGGLVNNLPYEIVAPLCDHTVAIDVAPCRSRQAHEPLIPGVVESVIGMFDLLSEKERLNKQNKATSTIYIHPKISNIRILDFDKMESVFEQSQESMLDLKRQLIEKGYCTS